METLNHALTRDQVREVDRLATQRLGIPRIVLMENAAIHVAAVIAEQVRRYAQKPITNANIAIVCGPGNNAGDGYAIARHLHNQGATVTLYAMKDLEALTGDAAINAGICAKMRLAVRRLTDTTAIAAAADEWRGADVIIDALLGTGFHGEVRQPMATVIETMNSVRDQRGERALPRIVAVDTPSGMDCQTGKTSASTLRADVTVTFVARKIGFNAPQAKDYLGEVVVAGIGAPAMVE